MNHISDKKLAVLIDADNAPADIIDRLLAEIAKYGIASVKRIYGDWSHGLNKWKAALLPHAIIPVQQFAYTKGKNATDMALVIDAMDLLYSGNFDGFCIVSSDSDFTRLASRLRESGLTVYGFGEKKTPEAFRQACDKFIYTEIFRPEKQNSGKNRNSSANKHTGDADAHAAMVKMITRAVRENADDLGWANLGPIGSYINKTHPDFDPRLYGFSKLSELIKSLDLFEHRTDANNQMQMRRHAGAEKNGRLSDENRKPSENTSADTPAENKRSSAKPSQSAAESSSPNKNGKARFAKLIPQIQQTVDAAADSDGWARLSEVLKQLGHIDPKAYGFDTPRDLVHAVYSEWLEIKKAGRGERVRVNKRFVSKD
ncbi:MAG: NYN domain-containing protein [Neisseria sp.]|nr:NYN domain-containing protein [Neisseria sp.]